MDTSNLCRSCMKEVALWERVNFDNRTTYMYSFCTNIQISEDDSLPKQFCYDCTVKIDAAYSYISEAQHINTTLLNLVNQRSVIVETNKHTEPLFAETEDIFDNNESIEPVSTFNPAKDEIKVKESKKMVNSPKLECTMCKKSFLSKVWFEKHLKNQHGGKVYSCPQCQKTFQKPSQLSVHAVTHSDERKFACACGKRYKRRKELTIHARTHADERPYQCDHCNMSFKLKSVLKSHLVLHQPDKPFLCSVCGWGFTQAGNLAVHMRRHTGAKPHACSRCDFRAAAASSLRRHERRHRASRPHRCRVCQKGFHDKGALTRHERSHTGARPYQCPGCTLRFVDSWKRKTHLMRAHRTPLARIPRMRADASALP
ncbi:uncharacterized protein [Choristoneura fumiferana]|uniref:uncharacterized protein n=1 Tax=Choristoneura fumiferana TaxID=7141 RepID=UPI003D154D0C